MDIISWECSDGEESGERKMFGYGCLKLAEVFESYLKKVNKDNAIGNTKF